MSRTSGPADAKIDQIKSVLQSADGPLHFRELARRLEKSMSYQTVYRYLTEFLREDVSMEGRYGPNNDHMVFVELNKTL